MRSKEFKGVKISGLACAVPDNRIHTDSFVKYFGEAKVNQFKKTTGINSRYITKGDQTASDLCFVAAKRLMEHKCLSGADFDAIFFVTQTPDYRTPATAFALHDRLGIKPDCLVFDLNWGCAGFVNGIYMSAGLIEGLCDRVLLLCGDCNTRHKFNGEISEALLFGDGGCACIIEKSEGIIRGMTRADGRGIKSLITPYPGHRLPYNPECDLDTHIMDGADVFSFAISKVPKLFKEFFEEFKCSETDFDYFMLHQANLMITDKIAKKLKLPPEKAHVSIGEFGNTDMASIPLGIVDLCEKVGGLNELRLICSGFGNGLSWAVVSFDINTKDVLPLIRTNEYWEDGRDL